MYVCMYVYIYVCVYMYVFIGKISSYGEMSQELEK